MTATSVFFRHFGICARYTKYFVKLSSVDDERLNLYCKICEN